ADVTANSVGSPTGEALYSEGLKSMEESLKGQDDNGLLHFRAAQFYDMLRGRMGSKDLREKYMALTRAEMEKAVAALKPQERFYADARIRLVDYLAGEGKSEQAEKLCREAIDQKTPQEIYLRRRLAMLIASKPERRDEAIALLATPTAPTPEQKAGVRGANLQGVEILASAELANMRLDKA